MPTINTSVILGSLLIAAVLHFITASERFIHASTAVGMLYILLGIFQLILAFGFYTAKNQPWAKTITTSCAILCCLFLVNQFASSHTNLFILEPYSWATVLRKLCEIIAGLYAALFIHQSKTHA